MVYFKHSEFDSPDKEGTGILMDSVFLSLLEEARAIAKIPFAITSGYRTEKYNNDLIKRGYSASKNSSHLKGLACDIATSNLPLANSIATGSYTDVPKVVFIECINENNAILSLPKRR